MPSAKQHAVGIQEAGLANLAGFGPAGRAVGRDLFHLAGPPHRHQDGDRKGRNST